MAQMLLLNPKGRSMARKSRKSRRKAPSAKQRANWARFAAMARGRARKARRAPARRRARRANPAPRAFSIRRVRRRRSNPIGLGSARGFLGTLVSTLKQAAVMGVGAVAVDAIYGQVSKYLPASLQRTPGKIGLGDAVKAIITVALGRALSGPTRGLSQRAALGALTVQVSDMARTFVPAGVLGYYVAAPVANASARIGPNRRTVTANYSPSAGATPLLNAYTRPGISPMLSGASRAAAEGFAYR